MSVNEISRMNSVWKSQKKFHSTLWAKRLASYVYILGQTVLPDILILKGQKLLKNAKIKKLKCDIWSNFQTLWVSVPFN